MTFYDALNIAMDEKGITPSALSKMTGISQSYFSNLKSHYAKDVTWEKAILIITALGMTPNEFYEIQRRVRDEN